MAELRANSGDTPAKLFRGYDSVSRGMIASTAVSGGCESTGGRSVVNIRVCENEKELAQALEIDASLSVSYLKALNVTAKMDFVKKLNVTARSVTIVVYASHETGTWTAKDIALKQGVQPPANGGDAAADFVQAYGDSFVSAATEGGEYYAVYTFHTETQTEQTALTTSLKGKGIYSGVTAEAEVQLKLSNFLKETSTNWTFNQEITGMKNPHFPTQDKLIQFALDFSSKEPDSPVTTGFKVMGYESVPGFRNFLKVKAARRHFLGEEGVLKSLGRLRGLQAQIGWLKRIYARYNYSGDTALGAFERQVKADVAKINDQIDIWDDNATASFEPLELPSLDKGEPVLTFTVGQPVSQGGEGGGDFNFMSAGEALRSQVRIASLQLADDNNVIRRLIVGYASDKASWTAVHGSGGVTREMFYLEDGQFLSRIAGRAGTYVDRLEFYLPGDRHTWAGGAGGGPFSWDVPQGTVVLGFSGRCAEKLDQIKIIHAALQPARYVQAL